MFWKLDLFNFFKDKFVDCLLLININNNSFGGVGAGLVVVKEYSILEV